MKKSVTYGSLPQAPENSIDSCILVFPHWSDKGIKSSLTNWSPINFTPMLGTSEVSVCPQECMLGAEENLISYIGHIVSIVRHVYRVLKKSGTLWVSISDAYDNTNSLMGLPWKVLCALQSEGWQVKTFTNIVASSENCMTTQEYLIVITKENEFYFNRTALLCRCKEANTWLTLAVKAGCPQNGSVLVIDLLNTSTENETAKTIRKLRRQYVGYCTISTLNAG